MTRTREEHWWDAEVLRLRGDLLLASSTGCTAEGMANDRSAADLARANGAKSIELRAVMRLPRAWENGNGAGEARDRLEHCYHSLTAGLDTRDLIEAKRLSDNTHAPV